MKRILNFIVLLIIIFFACSMFAASDHSADEKNNSIKQEKPKYWSGDVHFGMAANSGNSRNRNILGQLNLKYEKDKWRNRFHTDGQLSSSEDGRTAQNFNFAGESEYYFVPQNFSFGKLDYKYDDFAPYVYVTKIIAGLGWKPFDTEKVRLLFKLGPGYRRQKEAQSKKVDKDMVGYVAMEFAWHLNKNNTIEQYLSFTDGPRNDYTYSKTALLTKIIGNLGMEVSFTVKHNSKIPKFSKNKYKTDTATNVLLVYKF